MINSRDWILTLNTKAVEEVIIMTQEESIAMPHPNFDL